MNPLHERFAAERIRLGVIGLGRAAGAMLPGLAAHPGIDIVAAADPDDTARARFEEVFGGVTFRDAGELLEQGGIDAVYIASPHQFHVEHALAAASFGKHMIIEKPLALTLGDCERIALATTRAGVVTLVGHTHGFDRAIRGMREIIESGRVGSLRMMHGVAYTDFLYRPRRPEELDTALGGGIMFNQVPHQLEMARVLAREPIRSVRATTGAWDQARPTEGAMTAFVEFESGVAASLTYSGYDHFDSDELCSWVGHGGRLKSPSHGQARRKLAALGNVSESRARTMRGFAGEGIRKQTDQPVHQPHFGMLIVSCEKADMRVSPGGIIVYGDEGVQEHALPQGRSVPDRDAVADDFHDAVVLGRKPLQDAAWGLQTMQAVLALMRSAAERREIRLDAIEPT